MILIMTNITVIITRIIDMSIDVLIKINIVIISIIIRMMTGYFNYNEWGHHLYENGY